MPVTVPRLVRIPRHLLHAGLDDLAAHGVPASARDGLRALLADLPQVPDATSSALLVGPPSVTLPCLAVLARHVVQGLRDHNIALRESAGADHLRSNRRKLVFLDGSELAALVAQDDPHVWNEAVLCVAGLPARVHALLTARQDANHATFATTPIVPRALAAWRQVDLTPGREPFHEHV